MMIRLTVHRQTLQKVAAVETEIFSCCGEVRKLCSDLAIFAAASSTNGNATDGNLNIDEGHVYENGYQTVCEKEEIERHVTFYASSPAAISKLR